MAFVVSYDLKDMTAITWCDRQYVNNLQEKGRILFEIKEVDIATAARTFLKWYEKSKCFKI